MLPALLLLAALVAPAQAGPVSADSCQDSCTLDQNSDGQWSVYCHCKKKKPGSRPNSPARLLSSPFLRTTALRGSSEEDSAKVAANSCQSQVDASRASPHPARDLYFQATTGSKSICDCVSARVHFPVAKSCARTPANELTCSFSVSKTGKDLVQPLRDPTLEDYQSCLAHSANRASGAIATADSCDTTSCAMPPVCGPGLEPFNSADIGECCPRYSCEKRRTANAQEQPPRRNHEASAQ